MGGTIQSDYVSYGNFDDFQAEGYDDNKTLVIRHSNGGYLIHDTENRDEPVLITCNWNGNTMGNVMWKIWKDSSTGYHYFGARWALKCYLVADTSNNQLMCSGNWDGNNPGIDDTKRFNLTTFDAYTLHNFDGNAYVREGIIIESILNNKCAHLSTNGCTEGETVTLTDDCDETSRFYFEPSEGATFKWDLNAENTVPFQANEYQKYKFHIDMTQTQIYAAVIAMVLLVLWIIYSLSKICFCSRERVNKYYTKFDADSDTEQELPNGYK